MPDLKDMARSQSSESVESSAMKEPKYPYGLTINLDKETLEKLGLEGLPKVGEKTKIIAIASVTSVSEHESEDGKDRNVSLQIEKLSLSGAKEEESEDVDPITKKANLANALYPEVSDA